MAHIPTARHTPMTALYGENGNLIGYRCEHCHGLWTANHRPSEAHIMLPPVPGAKRLTRKNQAHAARVKAARKTPHREVNDAQA